MSTELSYELEYLGFTPNEVKVYLTLLRIGNSKAGRLAKEAGLERTSTYNALTRLLREGMVSAVIESNKKVFCSASPSKLAELFKEKEERALRIIPQLEKIKKYEREHETVLKFRGLGGMKTVMQDIINTCKEGEEYQVMGMEGQLSKSLPTFAKIFVARKDEKKLRSRALMREQSDGRKLSKYTKVRYLSKYFSSSINVNIYGNKVAFLIWSDVPEAVILDSKEAADSFRSYFNAFWKIAKP